MRLKTQSHLITIVVTGLVVWQIAQATRSEPAAPPPPAAVAQADEPDEPEAKQAEAGHPPPPRRLRPAPATRGGFGLLADATEIEVAIPESGRVEVSALIAQFAEARGTTYTVDPQAAQVEVRLGGVTTLDRDRLRSVLRSVDVTFVVSDEGVIHAYSVRNVGQMEPPPWRLVADGESVDPDQLVTRVIPIYHGSGNAIFATIRGLATRDTTRISNTLYVPGSEVVIVSDRAACVDYYERVVQALDVPAPELVDGR